MSEIGTKELRRLVTAASAIRMPWRYSEGFGIIMSAFDSSCNRKRMVLRDCCDEVGRLIVAAVNALPSLLASAEELAAIRKEIIGLHQRKCHDCNTVHWHSDSITPYVCCPKCGSQDTRKVKA